MQVPIMRLTEKRGFILYKRMKTKFTGCAPIPKYFIKNENTYYEDFRTEKQANKMFKALTS